MHDIRTITLDLDDTLWAIGPVIARAEERLYAWYAEHYPRIVERFSAPQILELRNSVIADHPDRIHDLSYLRRAVIARLGLEAGYADFPVDEAFSVFDEVRNRPELYSDVRPALQSLKSRYTLIAVTNGNANLAKIGITDLFDDFISAGNVGAAKPARQIFDVAVDAGGASEAQTLHVGDHPEIDVQGARDAGLRTAWINRDGAVWPDFLQKADHVVNDLHELDRILGPTASE